MSSSDHFATALGDPLVEEVAEDVYAYIQPDGGWWINNAGFIVGNKAVTSIDTCATEKRTTAYRRAIARFSDKPVRTLINTHHHGDHTYGNYQFEEATIVAHRLCREQMIKTGLPGERNARTFTPPDWGAIEVTPPFLTYEVEVQLWVDDLLCEVRHVATSAHTDNDSVVWIPEQSVLFSGDLLFKGGTPFILGGSLAGAIQAVNSLSSLNAATIVPGHGPVCGPEVIDEVLGYLEFVDQVARGGYEAGLSPLAAAFDTDLGDYAGLADSERLVGNLHRAYAELGGALPGVPIDRAAALADMVTFNGGRRLTCLA